MYIKSLFIDPYLTLRVRKGEAHPLKIKLFKSDPLKILIKRDPFLILS